MRPYLKEVVRFLFLTGALGHTAKGGPAYDAGTVNLWGVDMAMDANLNMYFLEGNGAPLHRRYALQASLANLAQFSCTRVGDLRHVCRVAGARSFATMLCEIICQVLREWDGHHGGRHARQRPQARAHPPDQTFPAQQASHVLDKS